jgi:hypothetical protein
MLSLDGHGAELGEAYRRRCSHSEEQGGTRNEGLTSRSLRACNTSIAFIALRSLGPCRTLRTGSTVRAAGTHCTS